MALLRLKVKNYYSLPISFCTLILMKLFAAGDIHQMNELCGVLCLAKTAP